MCSQNEPGLLRKFGMGERKKRRVVIASVLKPVDDTRMSEKIAASIAAEGFADVTVVGYPAAGEQIPGLHIHELPKFRRLSFKRLLMPWKILGLILRLKPSILIITTHELLCIGVLARILISCSLVYDVQENYFRNILHTDAFPVLFRPVLALYVRAKETLLAVFVKHFFLAEKLYAQELKFAATRRTIIENKVKKSSIRQRTAKDPSKTVLLFSGTLDENTGVIRAIELAIKLQPLVPDIHLKIAGYCPRQEVCFKIKNTIEPYPFIELIGGDHLVAHSRIMQEVAAADYGIIAYSINPSTSDSMPTKLYEYLGGRLPILLFDYEPWTALCAPFRAAIVIPPTAIHAAEILRQMKAGKFYTRIPEDVFWESESSKMLAVLQTL
jgi:glycosyltransferase involved in cell wall biosynthesis